MGTATLAPPASKKVVEYLQTLTAEEKDVAVVELLREAIQLNGRPSLMPVTTQDGEPLGVFVPQALAATSLKTYIPTHTPEHRARIEAAIADPSRTFDMSEFLKRVSREDAD